MTRCVGESGLSDWPVIRYQSGLSDSVCLEGRRESGGALVAVLLVLLLLTLMGGAALQMSQGDLEQAGLRAQQQRAEYLAESGVELAIGWFARPEQFAGQWRPGSGDCPHALRAGDLLSKRCRRSTGRASFSTDAGVSQFSGTSAEPDGHAMVPASSLFSEAPVAGATIEVRLFKPLSRGAICTVLSIGRTAGGARQAVQVELMEWPVPALTAAVGAGSADPSIEPIRLHWGSLRYDGDGRPALNDHDVWAYMELKLLARRFGRYYTSDLHGQLKLNGQGAPFTPDQVFAQSDTPLIFIDTIDGRPPRPAHVSNLPTIVLSQAAGPLSYIAGHLVLAPDGAPGRTVRVPSPDDGGVIELHGLQFAGGFHVAGQVRVEEESRLYGAVYAAEGLSGAERLELWYDRRLGTGWLAGWPVVGMLPGSWRWMMLSE